MPFRPVPIQWPIQNKSDLNLSISRERFFEASIQACNFSNFSVAKWLAFSSEALSIWISIVRSLAAISCASW